MARRNSAATRAMAAARAASQVLPVAKVESKPPVSISAEPPDAQSDAAALRAERLKRILPRAIAARYDRKLRMIVVIFANGAVFSFPPALLQGFSKACPEELADIRIAQGGAELQWPALNTDLLASGLFNQVFSSRKALARIAGQVKSPAKAAVARANGAKGGRPRKGKPSK